MDFIFGKMDFVGLLIVALGDRKIYHLFFKEICILAWVNCNAI